MPHNFHDTNGWLVIGIDRHMGLHWPVPLPLNMVPMPFWELNVAHPFAMAPGGNRNPTVLINGVESVKWECSPVLLWPHFPFAPSPLNLLFPLDVLFGSHKCWLPKMNVLAEGTPMTPVCIIAVISVNLDCFMWTKAPVSLILQPGTVETTPTLTDYGYGIFVILINLAIDALFHWITGGFKKKPPLPKGTVARANWRSLGRNLKDFFVGPRARTLQKTALRRFGKEALSKFLPCKWNTKTQSWDVGGKLWAKTFKNVVKPGLRWDSQTGSLGKLSNLQGKQGLGEVGQTIAGNVFPPLKLVP